MSSLKVHPEVFVVSEIWRLLSCRR